MFSWIFWVEIRFVFAKRWICEGCFSGFFGMKVGLVSVITGCSFEGCDIYLGSFVVRLLRVNRCDVWLIHCS